MATSGKSTTMTAAILVLAALVAVAHLRPAEASTLTVFTGPGCSGKTKDVNYVCGCYDISGYQGGYHFVFTEGQKAYLHRSYNCGDAHPRLLHKENRDCYSTGFKSVMMKSNILNLLSFLRSYELSSGQKINALKSSFILSPKAPASLVKRISLLTGFQQQKGMMRYLGVPIRFGRARVADYKSLIDKINAKIVSWKSKFLSQAGRVTLINSVLSSIPIYTAAATSIPKSVIKYIEKACARFLWNGTDGGRRRHWIPWDAIQRPILEGGLHIKSLWHIQIALVTKELWNIYNGSTLWATYARTRFKFDRGMHCSRSIPHGMPKAVFAAAQEAVRNNSRWIIGDGRSVDFLNNIWIGQGPLSDILSSPYTGPPITVREAIQNANHPVHLLLPSANLLRDISLSNHDDCCVWTATPSGSFSTSSAYNILSQHGVIRKPFARLWHHSFYRRAAFFCWKLLHRAIPVDSRISELGLLHRAIPVDSRISELDVPLVSRCSCCISPTSEDLNHLFLTSDLASSLWTWIAPILEVNVSDLDNITTRFWYILRKCNTSNPSGFISLYSVMLLIWEVWRARCLMRFEGKRTSFCRITHSIRFMVSSSLKIQTFKSGISDQHLKNLHDFGYFPSIKEITVHLVRWSPPVSGLVLHVNGASKGNPGPCGGGGCIRDSSGKLIFAFAHFYGVGGSLMAEVRAMCDGLRLASDYGFPLKTICSDSMILVNSFNSNKSPSWDCLRWWRAAQSLIDISYTQVVHIFGQANQVADALANVGCKNTSNQLFFSSSSLPRECKGPLTMDRSRIPSLRLG
ncbi:hypothetical protein Taro_030857 [Colocasia esculenta]|uniref:RNase H type-1 domain-containing protein n=1 Tax=Colocasia esculenta TaxID=4460 RepID=A0A843W1E8_COLES|nr:hypothetical protein [Colocasia esculenta]